MTSRSHHKFKHGMSKTNTYRTWAAMIHRCTQPSNRGYKRYGGRGIKVCDKWMEFSGFYEDMGDRPEGCTIDRINNDGDYEPGNCRWATQTQQCNNKGNNVRLDYAGKNMTLVEWIRELGLKEKTTYLRFSKGERPPQLFEGHRTKVMVTIDGVTKPKTCWISDLNIALSSFYYWEKKGHTSEQIIRRHMNKSATSISPHPSPDKSDQQIAP
jgi:hypothetical protein